MVPLIVILTVVVFIVVDLLLRTTLTSIEHRRVRQARVEALDIGLRLEHTDETVSLRRVDVENPKARILAVDDEAVVLDSLRKILVMAGYSIDTVERGQEALGLIQRRDYDFVFVDLRMPDMDGVEVTKAVKHLRPDIDVIVVTGYASIESAVATMKYGAMDYIQKPFTEDELTAFVDRSLIRRQDRIERQSRPQVHLITHSAGADRSRHKINVPAGVFISPAHAWISLELSGTVRVGIDDFTQRLLGPIDGLALPAAGQRVEKGAPLFSIRKADRRLIVPSPVSGVVAAVNSGLEGHLEYLHMRPYELGWVCTIDPANLPGDLQSLTIGANAVAWYRDEIDRYSAKLGQLSGSVAGRESAEEETKRLDDAAWQAFEQLVLHS
jgi:FixJ family two-component response regulator/glycine cleavage system H lipoate-binding protein